MINFFTAYTTTPDGPALMGELYTETNERVYAYRIYANGDYIPLVNNREQNAMPNTPKARQLMDALNNTLGDITQMLNSTTEPDSQNKLYWKIKETLGQYH